MSRDPIWRRYRDFLRPRPPQDVDDEIRFHLEMREEEARRAGLADDAARSAARERFGDVDRVVDELNHIGRARQHRQARADWIGDLTQDVRFALRSLRRGPAFAAAAVATIALGVGATTAIFAVTDAILLHPLPYARPDRLVRPWGWAYGEYIGLLARTRAYSAIAAYKSRSATVDDGTRSERLDGADVTANLFATLGVNPIAGRGFAPDADEMGRGDAVVLSYGLWRQWFGADPRVIGRRMMIDGAPHTVAGVMPASFRFPSAAIAFWTPAQVDRGSPVAMWAIGGFEVVARLRDNVTVAQAGEEMRRVAPGMRRLNVMWDPGPDYGKNAYARPLQEQLVGGTRPVLYLLAASAVLVLLIACVNVANLLLARATARERELAVRAALGGGRSRLMRQLLTESVVLAVIASAVGAALAAGGVRWMVARLPAGVPRASEISAGGPMLVFSILISTVAGIAFGLLPAWRATSSRGRSAVAGSVRGATAGAGHQRIASALIVGELAIAVVLVISAQLLVRSFRELRRVDPGFRSAHVLSARVSPPLAQYTRRDQLNALYNQILGRLAAMPGVQHVGLVDHLPLSGPSWGIALRVEGQFEDPTKSLPMADHFQSITPDYLPGVGIPVVHGRNFTADDRAGTPPVALVSQSVARRFWPTSDPLGKRIGYPYPGAWITVVGVVPDVKQDSLADTSLSAVYIPFAQAPGTAFVAMTIVAQVAEGAGAVGNAATFGTTVRDIIASIDRTVAVSDVRSADDVLARSLDKPRFTMAVVSGFAVAALLLGIVGVYGVLSYLVSQRAHEMGVRMALGASSGDILALVLGRGAKLSIVGGAVGAVLALLVTRFLRTLLFGVGPEDPATFLGVVVLFVAVALVAGVAPARRATRANPVEALRGD